MEWIPRWEGWRDPMSADAKQQLRQSDGGGGRWKRRLWRQPEDVPAEGHSPRRSCSQISHAKSPFRLPQVGRRAGSPWQCLSAHTFSAVHTKRWCINMRLRERSWQRGNMLLALSRCSRQGCGMIITTSLKLPKSRFLNSFWIANVCFLIFQEF